LGTVLGHGTTIATVQQRHAHSKYLSFYGLAAPGVKESRMLSGGCCKPQASLHGKLLCITKPFRYVDGHHLDYAAI